MHHTNTTKRKNGTIAELAKALNISTGYVHRLIRSGMPDDPIAAKLWRERQAAGDDSARRLRQERIALVIEQRRRAEIENAVRRGELMPLGDVKEAMVRVTSETRGELLRMASDMPPQISGLDAPAIQKKLRAEITGILKRLHDNFEKG
jgi:hypothetical protein